VGRLNPAVTVRIAPATGTGTPAQPLVEGETYLPRRPGRVALPGAGIDLHAASRSEQSRATFIRLTFARIAAREYRPPNFRSI
jgi:hypothetical protein